MVRPKGSMSKKTCPYCALEFGNLTAHVKAKHADKMDEYERIRWTAKVEKAVKDELNKPVVSKPPIPKPAVSKPAKKIMKKAKEDELDAKIESNLEGDEDIVGDKSDGSFLRKFKGWEEDFEKWWRDEK